MDHQARAKALEQIRENIRQFGYHLYVVSGGQSPRYAYTIGLSPSIGFELVFAGGVIFMYREIAEIIRSAASLLIDSAAAPASPFDIEPHGQFQARACDPSWANELLIGALDYYQRPAIPALQIVPDARRWTIDIPDMSQPFSGETAPIWRWLREPWTYPVPADAHATTNLDALRGEPVTEACRWEEDYWELFAGYGPDVTNENQRVVALGTLLATDPSLEAVLELRIGDGIWRERNSNWRVWKRL